MFTRSVTLMMYIVVQFVTIEQLPNFFKVIAILEIKHTYNMRSIILCVVMKIQWYTLEQ